MIEDKKQKKILHVFIFIFFILVLSSIILAIIFKYSVEGEDEVPFSISKFIVISSAETSETVLDRNHYVEDIVQTNDIFITLNKTSDKKNVIKNITIDNFKIISAPLKGSVKIFRPSIDNIDFTYSEDFEKDYLVFNGAQSTNLKLENMEIANQGGNISFSIATTDLGTIIYENGQEVFSDGRLLNNINLTNDMIKFSISFDICITLETDFSYKTNITLDLPNGDIVTNGVTSAELDVNKFVYKR